jgi:hypothetical protein
VPDGVAAWSVLRGDDLTPGAGAEVNNGAAPARRGVLVQVVRAIDLTRTAGLRDRSMVTLAWDILASQAELVGLDIGHVQPAGPGGSTGEGLLVRLGEDAAGEPRWLRVAHDHDPTDVCPVCGTLPWLAALRAAGASSAAPLYRPVDKGGNIGGLAPTAGIRSPGGRLNVRGLAKIWRRCCVRAGLEPMTPRQLRLGGAEDDVAHGASIVAVLRRGRWSRNTMPMVARLVAAAEQAGQGGGA